MKKFTYRPNQEEQKELFDYIIQQECPNEDQIKYWLEFDDEEIMLDCYEDLLIMHFVEFLDDGIKFADMDDDEDIKFANVRKVARNFFDYNVERILLHK